MSVKQFSKIATILAVWRIIVVVVVYSAPGSRPMIKTYKLVKVNNKSYNNTRSVHTRIQQFAPLKK